MKRDRGIGVVLDVIGHVPRKPFHDHAGVGGAGVLEGAARPVAAGVFGIEIGPQEQLADDQRNDPDPEQERRMEAHSEASSSSDIAGDIEARFRHDDVALAFGNPGRGDVAGEGMAKHQPEPEGNLPKTAIGDRELRIRGRLQDRRSVPDPCPDPACSDDGPSGTGSNIRKAVRSMKADRWPTARLSARLRNAVLCAVSCTTMNRKATK